MEGGGSLDQGARKPEERTAGKPSADSGTTARPDHRGDKTGQACKNSSRRNPAGARSTTGRTPGESGLSRHPYSSMCSPRGSSEHSPGGGGSEQRHSPTRASDRTVGGKSFIEEHDRRRGSNKPRSSDVRKEEGRRGRESPVRELPSLVPVLTRIDARSLRPEQPRDHRRETAGHESRSTVQKSDLEGSGAVKGRASDPKRRTTVGDGIAKAGTGVRDGSPLSESPTGRDPYRKDGPTVSNDMVSRSEPGHRGVSEPIVSMQGDPSRGKSTSWNEGPGKEPPG